jgi:peroxiredoxin
MIEPGQSAPDFTLPDQDDKYVIDGNGIVRRVFRRVKVDGHSAAVLDAVGSISTHSPHAGARR